MADIKIIQMDPLIEQKPTDLYETSDDGNGSYKETREQMLSYMSNNIEIEIDQIIGLQEELDILQSEINDIVVPQTTDDLPQGNDNWYATQDAGESDNLENLPTIVDLQDQINNISTSFSSGTYSPTATNISGISGVVTVNRASFFQISDQVIINLDCNLVATDSLIQFSLTLPDSLPPNFTNTNQAQLCGQALTTDDPNAMDGDVIFAKSDNANQVVNIIANVTIGDGNKYLNFSFTYGRQP